MDGKIYKRLLEGTVIPAHPLALTKDLKLDEGRQRRLTRYYLAAGVGGLAVGVHTTQFAIHRAEVGLYEPVLSLAMEEINRARMTGPFIKVAGICGPTAQAVREAELAARLGYDLGLVSLGGFGECSDDQLIAHVAAITEQLPVFGFYLQPSVGGRLLSYEFWKKLAELPGVCAIKTAPFNRYETLKVVRAVCYSSRRSQIALYTGNDDNIVQDLLAIYRFNVGGRVVTKTFVGGLLGHWSVWTRQAVVLFEQIRACTARQYKGIDELLALGTAVTDMNAAIFDAPNAFKGSIAGIHEVLRRQGLLQETVCLDPRERLSAGQAAEISRVLSLYPDLTDDGFVREFLENDAN